MRLDRVSIADAVVGGLHIVETPSIAEISERHTVVAGRLSHPVSARATFPPDAPDGIAWVERVLRNNPFAGRVRLNRFFTTALGKYDFAVAVPVCNECEMLPRMLAALRGAMGGVDAKGLAVFAVNGSEDGSARLIADWLNANAISGIVVDVEFEPELRTAPYARRFAMDIADRFVPTGAILTTDADSEVGKLWVHRALASIAGGFDLVCEDVRLDDAGLAALPDIVRFVGDAERAYYTVCDRLWREWSGEERAFAYRASGASLAISAASYHALGGLPLPDHGEDAALCALVLAGGRRVAMIANGGTRTSARLDGRAQGGCGAALSKRAAESDPECDSALIPLTELRRQAMYRLEHGRREESTRQGVPLRYSELLRELSAAQVLLSVAVVA